MRFESPVVAATQSAGPSGQLQVFAKLYDVAPDGSKTLVHKLISPVRVADVTQPVHIELPAIVHRVERVTGSSWCSPAPMRPTRTRMPCSR